MIPLPVSRLPRPACCRPGELFLSLGQPSLRLPRAAGCHCRTAVMTCQRTPTGGAARSIRSQGTASLLNCLLNCRRAPYGTGPAGPGQSPHRSCAASAHPGHCSHLSMPMTALPPRRTTPVTTKRIFGKCRMADALISLPGDISYHIEI